MRATLIGNWLNPDQVATLRKAGRLPSRYHPDLLGIIRVREKTLAQPEMRGGRGTGSTLG